MLSPAFNPNLKLNVLYVDATNATDAIAAPDDADDADDVDDADAGAGAGDVYTDTATATTFSTTMVLCVKHTHLYFGKNISYSYPLKFSTNFYSHFFLRVNYIFVASCNKFVIIIFLFDIQAQTLTKEEDERQHPKFHNGSIIFYNTLLCQTTRYIFNVFLYFFKFF